MKDAVLVDQVTRETILKLLSDDEVAHVSTAEAAASLPEGDEYLDLEDLARGVRKAPGATPPMGQVLPRRAVREATWSKILGTLKVVEATTKA